MIFYGARTMTGGQKVLSGLPCDKCDKDTVVLTNHYASGHVFWIPIFGVVTKTLAICPGCKRRMTLKRLNKKQNIGLTSDQMSAIQAELDDQLTPEAKKILKRRNITGIITFSIFCAVLVLAIISSVFS